MMVEFNSNLLIYERRYGGIRADTLLSIMLIVIITAILFRFISFYSLLFFLPAFSLVVIRRRGRTLGSILAVGLAFIIRRKRISVKLRPSAESTEEYLFLNYMEKKYLAIGIRSFSSMGISSKLRQEITATLTNILMNVKSDMEIMVSSKPSQTSHIGGKDNVSWMDIISPNQHYCSVYVLLMNRSSSGSDERSFLISDYGKLCKSLSSLGLSCYKPELSEITDLISINTNNEDERARSNDRERIILGKNFFRIGHEYCIGSRILDFNSGPSHLLPQALDSLNFPFLLSMRINKVDMATSRKILRYLSAERGSDVKMMGGRNDPRSVRARRQYGEIKSFLESLERDGYVLSYLDASLIVHSRDPSSVAGMMDRTENILKMVGFETSRVRYYSVRSVKSLIPIGSKRKRFLTNVRSVASILPIFMSEPHNSGLILGFNSLTEKPEHISLFGRRSFNLSIVGETGSGKSFFSRHLISNALSQDELDMALIIDPLGEYDLSTVGKDVEIIDLSEGDYMEIGSDLPSSSSSFIPDYIVALLDDLVGQNSSLREKIRMAVMESVASGLKGTLPIVMKVSESVEEISSSIRQYAARKLRRCISIQDKRKVMIIRLPRNIKASMKTELFAASLFIHQWMTFMPGKKAILIDEAHLLLSDNGIASLVENIVRNSRHFDTSVILVTQNFTDLLWGKGGTNIVNNTSEFFIFRNKEDSEDLRGVFGDLLPSAEYMRTLKGGKGDVYSECLRIRDGRCYPVKIVGIPQNTG